MTALAAQRNTLSKSTDCYPEISYKIAASTKIYAGSLVMLNSAGYAVPAVAAASNKGVVGVAQATVDNSSGAAGDLEVVCQGGVFLFGGSSLTQAMVGSAVYASDDQTISTTQGTNEPLAGKMTRRESATEAWILIDPAGTL